MNKRIDEQLNILIKKNMEENKNKVIFHVDVNNAYLSWTAVELLSSGLEKDIRNVPSIIGGDQSKRSGVVLAKSNPAKALGVKTGEPVVFALKKVPTLEIYPPNFLVYERKSEELNEIFAKYTDIIERYSIDESFLDVSEYLLGNTPLELAEKLKKEVNETLGFSVNIGISNLRMLAKTASDFKKPNMIHMLFSDQIEEKLWPLDISSLFSVGRKMQEGLRKLQINTIGDIAKFEPKFLEKRFGKHGIDMWKLANGIDETTVTHLYAPPKSISNSDTLVSNTKDLEIIKSEILKLTEHSTRRMRAENMKCKTVRLTLRDANFKDKTKQKSLSSYTDDTNVIYENILDILEKLYRKTEVRLVGVALENLCSNSENQVNLFDISDDKKSEVQKMKMQSCRNVKEEKLDYVLDNINKKYSQNIVKRARNFESHPKEIKKKDS